MSPASRASGRKGNRPLEPAGSMPSLRVMFRRLLRRFGPQHWWPASTRAEMMIGAILVQNTAWTHVERAIRNLRQARALRWSVLHALPARQLASLIRPAGYFNLKAGRLKAFARFLAVEFGGSLDRLFALPPEELRRRLLAVHGIGPETADSMMLYAGRLPVFVMDAYTHRVFRRHGWILGNPPYDALASVFTRALPPDPPLFNEFHALFVRLAKDHCRARLPACQTCPLRPWLPPDGPRP